MKTKKIALSFDFEECDLPRESAVEFPLEKGMRVSIPGANAVLDILERQGIKATFFCTANFAENAPGVMKRLIAGGHEIGSHGVDHWQQDETDPKRSKEAIEKRYGVTVYGYRQPRMFPVDDASLKAEGFLYNSSINPAFIPGRYCHFDVPRRPFMKAGLLQLPASVVPVIRFPLFWLALHLLPEFAYRWLVKFTLAVDGCFITYFHPWEFFQLGDHPEWKIPWMIRYHAGQDMSERLERFIVAMKKAGSHFVTLREVALDK